MPCRCQASGEMAGLERTRGERDAATRCPFRKRCAPGTEGLAERPAERPATT